MACGSTQQLPALLPTAQLPAGPTPWSNWVLKGRIIAGAYPGSLDDQETEALLTLLLELGVTTFVCLQAEVNIHVPEHAWRAGRGLRPYIRDAQRLLSRAQQGAAGAGRITQRKVDFLHLPVIDGSVTTDSAMSRLADDCCARVLAGECLYIHCWGGHGRTGTLVATMLGRLYGLRCADALRYTQEAHDRRIYPQGVRSPQTNVQRAQVKRLLTLPNGFAHLAAAAAAARQPALPSYSPPTAAASSVGSLSASFLGSSSGGGASSISSRSSGGGSIMGVKTAPARSGSSSSSALCGVTTPIKSGSAPTSLARPNVSPVRSPVTPPLRATACSSASLALQMQQLALAARAGAGAGIATSSRSSHLHGPAGLMHTPQTPVAAVLAAVAGAYGSSGSSSSALARFVQGGGGGSSGLSMARNGGALTPPPMASRSVRAATDGLLTPVARTPSRQLGSSHNRR